MHTFEPRAILSFSMEMKGNIQLVISDTSEANISVNLRQVSSQEVVDPIFSLELKQEDDSLEISMVSRIKS